MTWAYESPEIFLSSFHIARQKNYNLEQDYSYSDGLSIISSYLFVCQYVPLMIASDIIVSLQLKDQESMHSYELWDIFPKNDVLKRMRALLLVYTCKSWWQDSEVRLAINACYDNLKLSTNTTVLCRRTGPALAKHRALCTTLTNRSCQWHCLQGGSLCQQSNKLIRPNKSVTDSTHAQTGGGDHQKRHGHWKCTWREYTHSH